MPENIAWDATESVEQWQSDHESTKKRPCQIGVLKGSRQPDKADEKGQRSYKMLQAMNTDVEIIGPIQMGLNKPIHFTDFSSSVRDVVNIVAVAVIDAYVEKIKHNIW